MICVKIGLLNEIRNYTSSSSSSSCSSRIIESDYRRNGMATLETVQALTVLSPYPTHPRNTMCRTGTRRCTFNASGKQVAVGTVWTVKSVKCDNRQPAGSGLRMLHIRLKRGSSSGGSRVKYLGGGQSWGKTPLPPSLPSLPLPSPLPSTPSSFPSPALPPPFPFPFP